MNRKVFLTDANYKHTLATIRSLGIRGLKVDVGSSFKSSLGSFSKYVHSAFVYPDPKLYPRNFVNLIIKISKKNNYDVIMPIGYHCTVLSSKFKDELENVSAIPVTDYERLKVAANKGATISLAESLGIPVPDTFLLERVNTLEAGSFEYPLVVKGIRGSGIISYVTNPRELVERFSLFCGRGYGPLLVQKYVRGEGYGFFALFNHGKPRAMFMHRRIREYPITGGASTVAESVYEPKIKEYGLKILSALDWHGVAMVEFKKDIEENDFKLLEINAKFWGSLDLAITCGIDFPYLLYRMAVDGDIKPSYNYRVGVRFMWPFPDDVYHTLANPSDFPGFVKDLLDVNVKKNIVLSDLKPTIIQLLETALIVTGKFRDYAQFRYPHGRPERDVS